MQITHFAFLAEPNIQINHDTWTGPYAHLCVQNCGFWTENWMTGNAQFFVAYYLNFGEQTSGEFEFIDDHMSTKNLWWWYPEDKNGEPNAIMLTCTFIPTYGTRQYYLDYWFALGQILVNFVPVRLWKETSAFYGYELRNNCPRIQENNYSILIDVIAYGQQGLSHTDFSFVGGYVENESWVQNSPHCYSGWCKCPSYFLDADLDVLILPDTYYVTQPGETVEAYGIMNELQKQSQQVVSVLAGNVDIYVVWKQVGFGWFVDCVNHAMYDNRTTVRCFHYDLGGSVVQTSGFIPSVVAGENHSQVLACKWDLWEYTVNPGPMKEPGYEMVQRHPSYENVSFKDKVVDLDQKERQDHVYDWFDGPSWSVKSSSKSLSTSEEKKEESLSDKKL
jgi:hypothetical protein